MIFIIAVLPPLIILFLVNWYCGKDRPPFKDLAILFLLGAAVVTAGAMYIGVFLNNAFSSVLGKGLLYQILNAFLVAAFFEEGFKYLMLRWRVWKPQKIKGTVNAISCSVTLTMGFALVENVLYMISEKMVSIILRACFSVPGHMAHAILMGYFMGLAQKCREAGDEEGMKKNLRRSLWVPILTHGGYDLLVNIFKLTYSTLMMFVIFAAAITLIVITVRILIREKRCSDMQSDMQNVQ